MFALVRALILYVKCVTLILMNFGMSNFELKLLEKCKEKALNEMLPLHKWTFLELQPTL